jgi:small conductance mechanosensitive channel
MLRYTLVQHLFSVMTHTAMSSAWDDFKRFLIDTWKNLSQPPGIIVPRTLGALLIAAATLLVARYLSNRTRRALAKTRLGPNPSVLVARVVRFVIWVVGAIWILSIFSVSFTALAAILSVATLAVSLSFQDVLKNLVAGIYLLAERPFRIGDSITVKGVTGMIEDIEMRVTYLRTERGERIVMPNQTVFTEVVVNRTVLDVQSTCVTLEIPRAAWEEGVKQRILGTVSQVEGVAPTPAPRLELLGLTPESVKWALYLWLDRTADTSNVLLALGDALPEASLSANGMESA